MGKYLRRALKYYVFLLVLITLVIVLLALVGFADLTNINTLFRNGYTAVWEIALIFFAVALIYPKFGFGKKDLTISAKNWDEARMNLMIALGDRGYKLESEDGKVFTFRKKWFVNRLAKFTEDRITITLLSGGNESEAPDDQTGEAEAPNQSVQTISPDGSVQTDSQSIQQTISPDGSAQTDSQSGDGGQMNRYTLNIEGITKDVVRIVSTLYRVQSQNRDE